LKSGQRAKNKEADKERGKGCRKVKEKHRHNGRYSQ